MHADETLEQEDTAGKESDDKQSQDVMTEEEEMLDLIKNKEVRLDDLCKLLYVGEDEAWMAKKKIGIAAVRQMRDATWQAAAKTNRVQPIGMLNVTIHSFSGTGAIKNAYVVLELRRARGGGQPVQNVHYRQGPGRHGAKRIQHA